MRLFWVATLLVVGCGGRKVDDSGTIKSIEKALDVRISEEYPDATFPSESVVNIGFDASGLENRMLLFFPEVTQLYDEDVITSSVASAELYVYCDEIPVNPQNIVLEQITRPCSPHASWNAPFALLPTQKWANPGGDFAADETSVTPAIEGAEDDSKKLKFDITELVTRMVTQGEPNYGFVIRVKASELNAEDRMDFFTTNASSNNPASALVFTKKDTIE